MTKGNNEFITLREEMREWQTRRFSLLGIAAVFVTGFIGWVVDKPKEWAWDIASMPVLLLIAGACLLTSHFARLIVRISTYLEVFHEFKWQTRLANFRKREKPYRTSQLIGAFYFGVAITAVVTFVSVCEAEGNLITKILFMLFCLILLASLISLVFKSTPHEFYMKRWQQIQNDELSAQQSHAPDPFSR